VGARLPGFKGEYLWEFDIAEKQLLVMAESFPPGRYGWRPAETARSVSEVLVHVAAGNLTLLGMVGIEAAPDLYGQLERESVPRMMAMIARNGALEKDLTDKPAVVALLKRSLDAVRASFKAASDAELDRLGIFFGEETTVRRIYLRGLSHMHEHMGQLIAYTRAMGMPAPWQDWRESGRKIVEHAPSAKADVS
jgi:uncharacterized damage-inducible protein DinB